MLTNRFSDDRPFELAGALKKVFAMHPVVDAQKKRTRLLVQKGIEHLLLRMEDIILFYTENKIVYVVDRFEKKYLIDSNLCDLEKELDTGTFFRANRQYIISMDFIRSFRAYEKVKIRVDMNLHTLNHLVIVSQETAPLFRKWVHEA